MLRNQIPLLLEDLGMEFPTETSKKKYRYGIYECLCGKKFKAQSSSIARGHTISCGCYKKQRIIKNITTHGLANHDIYHTWFNMIYRTTNKKNKQFNNYGGRGITVCDRWLELDNFIKDMYPSWEKGLSIDRINNNGNYEPSNCRWTTKAIQAQNTRAIRSTNKSEYRGVCWNKHAKKWISQIMVYGKHKHIGCFNTALEAAKAYDKYVVDNNLEHTINFRFYEQKKGE